MVLAGREGEGMSTSDEERRGWGIGFGGREVSGLGGQEGEAMLPGLGPRTNAGAHL